MQAEVDQVLGVGAQANEGDGESVAKPAEGHIKSIVGGVGEHPSQILRGEGLHMGIFVKHFVVVPFDEIKMGDAEIDNRRNDDESKNGEPGGQARAVGSRSNQHSASRAGCVEVKSGMGEV